MSERLAFDSELYSLSAVEAAAAAYAELASIAVAREGDAVVVTFAPKGDQADLLDHFSNHVLSLTIQDRVTKAGEVSP